MRRNITILLLCLVLLDAPRTAKGQPQTASPDSALQINLNQLEGTRLLLQTAIQSALNNATSVRTAEAAYIAARGTTRREGGTFDPELFFTFNHLDQQQPTASFFSGASVLSTKQNTATGGVRFELPFGTDIEASVNTVRLETNSSFAFLNPQNTAFGNLSFRQPLLKGFHISARKQVSKADRELEAAKARYDQEALAISAQVEQSYWDLYAAERDYAVQQLTRDRAEAFLKDTEVRARTGLIGPNQVANARTFLAQQEILLIDREEQLDRLSDQLCSLIGMRPDQGRSRFIAVDNPPDNFALAEADDIVQHALKNNLGIQAANSDVEARRALSTAAFWEALPNVSLVGSIGGNGLSGNARNVIFGRDTLRTTVGGNLGDAVNQAIKRDFPTWSLGVELTLPIGLRSGLGEQEKLEADVVIAEQRYVQATRILEEQVRASHRELSHGQRRLKAAREGVQAAQEQVRIGLIEFENGRSTAFELVRLGADFAAAQQQYSQALVRGAKAAAALRQLTSGAYPGPIPR